MKFRIIILLLCLFVGFAAAEEYYWPKSYYAQAGFGTIFSNGDLNERGIKGADSAGVKGKIYPPDYGFLLTPDFALGVNLGPFSIGINFQYWSSEQSLTDYSGKGDQDTRMWRAGLEVTYNIFYPEDFQIGLGAGYSYSSVKAKNAAVFGEDVYDAEFMGSAVAFIANVHYYLNDNFAIVPAVKVYENWFKNVHCKRIDNNDLDPFLWQTFVLASVSVQYQF